MNEATGLRKEKAYVSMYNKLLDEIIQEITNIK